MRQKIFFTSDWHVGHENCLHLDGRPFKDLDHMHRYLIKNFNAVVPKDATTYFLGDIGLCKGELIEKVYSQLNGKKILVRGNHDKGKNTMLNKVFDLVLNIAAINISNELITMSHCPLMGIKREKVETMNGYKEGDNFHGEHKHIGKYTLPDFGQFHLHGHIHSPNNGKSKKILGRQYDVGVVANKYRPVSINQIESFIRLTNNRKANKCQK